MRFDESDIVRVKCPFTTIGRLESILAYFFIQVRFADASELGSVAERDIVTGPASDQGDHHQQESECFFHNCFKAEFLRFSNHNLI